MRRAVLVMNQRTDTALWPTVEVLGPGPTLEVDASSGELRPVRDDSPYLAGLQLALQPGSARLLAWA